MKKFLTFFLIAAMFLIFACKPVIDEPEPVPPVIEEPIIEEPVIIPDTTSPVKGVLSITEITLTGCTATWTDATDETSTAEKLLYKLYFSVLNNINTIENAEKNGTAFADWGSVKASKLETLTENTDYFFTVLVKDEAENKTLYDQVQIKTLKTPDTTSPVVGVVLIADITKDALKLSWTQATDNETEKEKIQYEVKRGETIIKDYTENILTAEDTGLTANTEYTYTVSVKDEAGNIGVYPVVKTKTLAEINPYYVFNSKWEKIDITAYKNSRSASGEISLNEALEIVNGYNSANTENQLFLNLEDVPIEQAPNCEVWIVDKDTYAPKYVDPESKTLLYHFVVTRSDVYDRLDAWKMDCLGAGNGMLFIDNAPPPERENPNVPPVDLRSDDEKYIIYSIWKHDNSIQYITHANEEYGTGIQGYDSLDEYFTNRVAMWELDCIGTGSDRYVISGRYYTPE